MMSPSDKLAKRRGKERKLLRREIEKLRKKRAKRERKRASGGIQSGS